MYLQFIPAAVVGFLGILYSLLISRGEKETPSFPPFTLLKILAWAIPLLLCLFYFTKSPFSYQGGFPDGGYGIGMLIGGLVGGLSLLSLRLPTSPSPSPRLTASLSLILLSLTLLYFLPYELPIPLFGFLLAFSLFHFLGSTFLSEEFRDDLTLGQNALLLSASALIFGVYHAMEQKKFLKEFWSLLPLSLLAIALLSLFLSSKQKRKGILPTLIFYLIFTFLLSYFYIRHLPFFYVIAGGAVTAGLFVSLLLIPEGDNRLAIVSILLLFGLLALSFRLSQAYGICLAGISFLPFSALLLSEGNPFSKRAFNLFLLSISLLAILRLFYQLFASTPYAFKPTLYDFFPLLGLLVGALLPFFWVKGESYPPLPKLLLFLLSLTILSFLISIYGLSTSAGIFSGVLLASILLLFLSLLPNSEINTPSFAILFLLLALLLIPLLSPLSTHLKRLFKFYITLGTIPITLLLIFFLSPQEGKKR